MKFSTQALSTVALASALATAAPSGATKPVGLEGSTNQVAWWGQGTHDLSEVCEDDAFSHIMLSFLTDLNPPKMNLAGHAGGASQAQKAAGYPDLIDGTQKGDSGSSVAEQISACQANGKKVMISFGGDQTVSDAKFTSRYEALSSANMAWDLFLGGTGNNTAIRPFGKDVVLDGIDLDNETGDSSYYVDFVKQLRTLFAKDTSKTYYISGAPQCPAFDTENADIAISIPKEAMPFMDFMNVQFYNNQGCQLGSDGFEKAIQGWSDVLAETACTFMLAVPASDKAATGGAESGVQSPEDLAESIKSVMGMDLPNFGGVAVWDAGWAMDNENLQDTIADTLSG